ncbi:MAG: hypothetical protein P9L94_02290 [Candidatus Hinthialibacter antarcticus]|nr:hypothetical protein [Candidatus Hinthialibacter antarcticus]
MARPKSEKFLAIAVIFLGLVFGAPYLYQNIDLSTVLLQSDVDEKKEAITAMQDVMALKPGIESRYNAMMSELTLGLNGKENEAQFNEMLDSEQELQIRQQVTQIFEQLGLQDAYDNIQSRDPERDDEFKIVSISIDNLECTPDQLGQLLYRLEEQSEVMEVKECSITNQITDRGDPPRRRETLNFDMSKGLLTVDLQISRLVEYKKGEAPKKKRS